MRLRKPSLSPVSTRGSRTTSAELCCRQAASAEHSRCTSGAPLSGAPRKAARSNTGSCSHSGLGSMPRCSRTGRASATAAAAPLPPQHRCRRRCWPAAAPPGALRRPCGAPGLPSATGWGCGPQSDALEAPILIGGRSGGFTVWQRQAGSWPERWVNSRGCAGRRFETGGHATQSRHRSSRIFAAQVSLVQMNTQAMCWI